MTFSQIFIILILIIPLIFVFLNKLREDVAAMLMAVSLGIAQYMGMGIVGPANTPSAAGNALTGIGTPEVITLISLFILTACLDKYGLTKWIAEKLLSIGGRSESRMIGLFTLTAALLSMFMNNLAAGALLLPSALEASRESGIKPSKLLLPIAYGTMLGGAASYFATANIIVSGLLPLANPPQAKLQFLDFTPTGGLIAIVGIIFLTIFGKYILPDKEPPKNKKKKSGDELSNAYKLLERLWEVSVTTSSSIANKKLSEARFGEDLGISVLGMKRENRNIPISLNNSVIRPNDILYIIGREERILKLHDLGLSIKKSTQKVVFESKETSFVELLVPSRSDAVGKTLKTMGFRANYGFTAIALWRADVCYRTDVADFKLEMGDTILLMGPTEKLDSLKVQQDFVVLEASPSITGLDRPRVFLTLAILVSALSAMVLGTPIEITMFTAAVLILLTKLLKPEEAYHAINWRAVFLITGTMAVSKAMMQTGLAELVGNSVVNYVRPFGGMGLVVGTYLLSAGLTQVMGAQVSPLVVGPISLTAAIQLGVNPQAIAVVTALAGSISFITPLAHPVNLIMIAPANYSFRDFVRSGWILTIVCFIALMIAVPLFWNL